MGETTIQWCSDVWNPVTGCTKVSQGCKNCYAERVFPRPYPGRDFTDVRTHPDRLDQPLRWRKPRRVFVNSMSDLFHEDVPNSFIETVFGVMALAKQHTFQILTKRPKRMLEWFGHSMREGWAAWAPYMDMQLPPPKVESWPGWPLPNVWLGVSVEDQETADERIPVLLQTPAAVRFISAEPLLGAVDLERWLNPTGVVCPDICPDRSYVKQTEIQTAEHPTESIPLCPDCGAVATWTGYDTGLDWVIVGGESGPKARPCDVEWIGGIVNQCKDAGVPVFVKQFGARPIAQCRACSTHRALCRLFGSDEGEHGHDGIIPIFMKDRKGGDPAEWPADLRVREFPA